MKNLATWIAALSCVAVASFATGQAGGAAARKHLPQAAVAFRAKAGTTVLDLSVQDRGDIFIELDTKDAPKTTAQIISLTKANFYDGQRFYKVLKSPRPYLLQTGDPASKTEPMDSDKLGSGGSGTKVPYEDTHQEFFAGRVVLATVDGDKDSGDSQFYILLGDYDNLLKGTGTVFGHVILGMEIVQKIELGDTITTAKILTG